MRLSQGLLKPSQTQTAPPISTISTGPMSSQLEPLQQQLEKKFPQALRSKVGSGTSLTSEANSAINSVSSATSPFPQNSTQNTPFHNNKPNNVPPPPAQQQYQKRVDDYEEDTLVIDEENKDDLLKQEEEDMQSMTGSSSTVDAVDNIQLIMETVVSSSMDAFIVINERGTIKNINGEALKLTQYSRWELAGHNIKKITPKEIAVEHDKYLKRYVISRIKRIIGEARDTVMLRKDSSRLAVTIRVQELKDRSGLAFFGVIRSRNMEQQLQQSKELIISMLPKEISQRVESGEKEIAEEVMGTVVFVDIVNFTRFASEIEPYELVQKISKLFNWFDEVNDKYELERVKTIGDCYMSICGISKTHVYDHAFRVMGFAKEIIQNSAERLGFNVRIGIATGKFVAGVISSGKRITFDVWGAIVQLANKLCGAAPVNGIAVSEMCFSETSSRYKYEADMKTATLPDFGTINYFVAEQ